MRRSARTATRARSCGWRSAAAGGSARRGGWSGIRGSRRRRWPATRAVTSRSPGSRTAAPRTTASTSRCAGRATGSGSRSGSPPAGCAACRRRSARAATCGGVGRAGTIKVRGSAPRARVRPRGDAAAGPAFFAAPHRGRELRPRLRGLGRPAPDSRAVSAAGLLGGRGAPAGAALPPRPAARSASALRPQRRFARPGPDRPRQRARGVGARPRARGGDRGVAVPRARDLSARAPMPT